MNLLNPETKKYVVKTITMLALTFLLTSCAVLDKVKSVTSPLATPATDYSEPLRKNLLDPCFNLGGVTEKEFQQPSRKEEIWAHSIFTETKNLPIAPLVIMNGLDKGEYSLSYEYYMYSESGNCVLFRSASIVNITKESPTAVDFDLNIGKSIKETGKSEKGNVIALYDLTNPNYIPATHTPEFEGLGIDPRLFQYMQLHPGQVLLKITVYTPKPITDSNNILNSDFIQFKPKFSFFQIINKKPDEEFLNLHDLLYKFSPIILQDLGKKVVQFYGN